MRWSCYLKYLYYFYIRYLSNRLLWNMIQTVLVSCTRQLNKNKCAQLWHLFFFQPFFPQPQLCSRHHTVSFFTFKILYLVFLVAQTALYVNLLIGRNSFVASRSIGTKEYPKYYPLQTQSSKQVERDRPTYPRRAYEACHW